MNHDAGKGDLYRKVDWQKYGDNYDAIFRRSQSSVSGQVEQPLDQVQENNDQAPVKQAANKQAAVKAYACCGGSGGLHRCSCPYAFGR